MARTFAILLITTVVTIWANDIKVIQSEFDDPAMLADVIGVASGSFEKYGRDIDNASKEIAEYMDMEYKGNWITILVNQEIGFGGTINHIKGFYAKFSYQNQTFIVMKAGNWSERIDTQQAYLRAAREKPVDIKSNSAFDSKDLSNLRKKIKEAISIKGENTTFADVDGYLVKYVKQYNESITVHLYAADYGGDSVNEKCKERSKSCPNNNFVRTTVFNVAELTFKFARVGNCN